jgi:methyl-accepting chemotaxis protein
MSGQTDQKEIASLLQNLVEYLAKLKDPRDEVSKAIKDLDKKMELLLKRTESVTAGMERLIAVIEDTFSRERAMVRGEREPKELPKVRQPDEVLRELQDQAESVKQQMSDLQFTYRSGFIKEEEYQRKLKELNDRKKELRDRLKELGA